MRRLQPHLLLIALLTLTINTSTATEAPEPNFAATIRAQILDCETPQPDRIALLTAMTDSERLTFLESVAPEELLDLLNFLPPQDAAAVLGIFPGTQWKMYFDSIAPAATLAILLKMPHTTTKEYLALLNPNETAELFSKVDTNSLITFLKPPER